MLRRDGMLWWREELSGAGVVGFIVTEEERVLAGCRFAERELW